MTQEYFSESGPTATSSDLQEVPKSSITREVVAELASPGPIQVPKPASQERKEGEATPRSKLNTHEGDGTDRGHSEDRQGHAVSGRGP